MQASIGRLIMREHSCADLTKESRCVVLTRGPIRHPSIYCDAYQDTLTTSQGNSASLP